MESVVIDVRAPDPSEQPEQEEQTQIIEQETTEDTETLEEETNTEVEESTFDWRQAFMDLERRRKSKQG